MKECENYVSTQRKSENKQETRRKFILQKLLFSILTVCVGILVAGKFASSAKVIWIGDSRTVGLSYVGSSNDVWLSVGGTAHDYFRASAIPALQEILDKDPCQDVVIHYGCNDCANEAVGGCSTVNDYIRNINYLIKAYPDTRFYFASVTPVTGNYPSSWAPTGSIDCHELNSRIRNFNKRMHTYCNATFINTYKFVKTYGFGTYDGIHYDSVSNTAIYKYIISQIRKSY